VVHLFLALYAAILAYILLGLVFNFSISADIFFDLSFAILFFALAQSFYELGARRTLLYVALSSVIGFLGEVLGANTGVPFGKYSYGDLLGAKVLGVSVVVPLLWFVITFIAFSIVVQGAARSTGRGTYILQAAALTAFGATSWDILVDPMFSSPSYGYWTWAPNQGPTLSGVPLTNFVGWFVLVFLMVACFLYLLPKGDKIPVMKRRNTVDSYIVYVLLMVDGIIANSALGHSIVIVAGVSAMLGFMAISFFRARNRKANSDLVSLPDGTVARAK
jgi:uncharacterized membrane protein